MRQAENGMSARFVEPVTLSARGVRLVPLTLDHEAGLKAAAADGELWNIRVTSVPGPLETRKYIEDALKMREDGNRFPFAVIDEASGEVLGSTSYHDVVPAIRRLEIGYTWYARRCQRTHINTTAKLLMLAHAFDTLGCHVVGWRTDNYNFASQRHRAAGRAQGRRDPWPCPAPRWHHPRHRDVQPARGRVARSQGPPAVPAGQAPGLSLPRRPRC